ncbi:MAG: phosphoadenylyl-sulfate reductase [Caulobacteraceae bacterium]
MKDLAMAYDMSETTTSTPEAVAAALDAQLRDATPQEIIRAALAAFPGRLALSSSFGAESAVLLHMVSQIDPSLPILFLETGMLFGQTLDYRKSLSAKLGLTDVRDLKPAPADLLATDPKNILHKTDIDACCNIRKVIPLDTALEGFDAWITGRKRFHGANRARLRVVEAGGRHVKFNPLANWGKAELDAYVAEHDLPTHPLVAAGFPSIGCWPCTKPAEANSDDVRAGRWSGSEKTECGIHVARAEGPSADISGDS